MNTEKGSLRRQSLTRDMKNKEHQARAILGKESSRREQQVNTECPRWEATWRVLRAEGRRPVDGEQRAGGRTTEMKTKP